MVLPEAHSAVLPEAHSAVHSAVVRVTHPVVGLEATTTLVSVGRMTAVQYQRTWMLTIQAVSST